MSYKAQNPIKSPKFLERQLLNVFVVVILDSKTGRGINILIIAIAAVCVNLIDNALADRSDIERREKASNRASTHEVINCDLLDPYELTVRRTNEVTWTVTERTRPLQRTTSYCVVVVKST